MLTVTVKTEQKTLRFYYDAPVSADRVLEDAGLFLPHPCGGRGTCQKCKILLDGKEVLACRTTVTADATIDYTSHGEVQGVTQGCDVHPKGKPLTLEGYGAAIDIGTTTVAAYIYNMKTGERVAARCLANSQSAYGADVISRIDRAVKGEGEALKGAVQRVLRQLTVGYEIGTSVICANTTMLYLLTGEDPASLAVAPYRAEHLFGRWVGNTYLAPCISAFVGADVTAAMLACRLDERQNALLVDIGTNGEMVLSTGGRLLACSTAAGPCFEGAGISCGTAAVTGAIHRVRAVGREILFETIDGAPPIGLCGTGLVDAVAALLTIGVIDETGYMEEPYTFGESDVVLTPEDVRAYQLAKSAIRSGIDTLLHFAGLAPDDVSALYLAGGFGSYLNAQSAARTGLLPAALASRTVAIGNGAGMGAAMMLLGDQSLARAKDLAAATESVELANSPYFATAYMNNMYF